MSKKIKYVPPVAELIQLAPCERLAAFDWEFQKIWKHEGFFTVNGASGIAVTGGFGSNDYMNEDAGFIIKTE